MRSTITVLTSISLFAFNYGCASMRGPDAIKFVEVPAIEPLVAVYIGRPYGSNVSAIPLKIELNGQPLVSLGINDYTRLELPPGTYKFAAPDTYLTTISFGVSVPMQLTLEPGKRYFVEPTTMEANIRPKIAFIGTLPTVSSSGTLYGGFVATKLLPSEPAPSRFEQLFLVPAENRGLARP